MGWAICRKCLTWWVVVKLILNVGRRRSPVFRIASVRVICVVGLATFLVAASEPSCAVMAQGSECSEACKAAYGECYKSSHNRGPCEAQLQRCLQGCIAGKRG
jgi:hypothetical protein